MKSFPEHFTPQFVEKKEEYKNNRITCYLRRYIYEIMLSNKFSIPNECSINLQDIKLCENECLNNHIIDKKIIQTVIEELNNKGWKTELCYGDTMLFIFTEDKIPQHIIKTKTF